MPDPTELKAETRPRVLVTGQAGMVGRVLAPTLDRHGFDVVGLDLSDGRDLLDPATVRSRLQGCRYVVHLAAVDDEAEAPDPLTPASTGGTAHVLRTNVGGTALLLAEAARAGVERVVMLSSVDVFGCFMGQGLPTYLPLDDAHPIQPHGAYAWSKLAAEELCETFTRATGAPLHLPARPRRLRPEHLRLHQPGTDRTTVSRVVTDLGVRRLHRHPRPRRRGGSSTHPARPSRTPPPPCQR